MCVQSHSYVSERNLLGLLILLFTILVIELNSSSFTGDQKDFSVKRITIEPANTEGKSVTQVTARLWQKSPGRYNLPGDLLSEEFLRMWLSEYLH